MYDLYLKQEKEFDKLFVEQTNHRGGRFVRNEASEIEALRKSHLVALLDKAIEELEGEKKKDKRGKYCNDCGEEIGYDASTEMYFCPSCPMQYSDKTEQKSKLESQFNKGLSTAISHLTNLRDKILKK